MRYRMCVVLLAGYAVGCGGLVNVAQERDTLLKLDKEWSDNARDLNKFISYYAPDASMYPPGMPVTKGPAAIRDVMTQMMAAPGFALQFAATKAEVSASGDTGYTAGAYQMTMNGATEGKDIELWKKQADGQWKVVEDIFNADAQEAPPSKHVMVAPAAITWADAPPSLPPGAKMAVIMGDPSKAEPFVIRAQMPAGYKIAPHWHPTDENVTVLSGTVALGMGDKLDESAMQSLGVGGYASLPAKMPHSFMTKTAATIQVHAMGPFAVNYVNPADDPSAKK